MSGVLDRSRCDALIANERFIISARASGRKGSRRLSGGKGSVECGAQGVGGHVDRSPPLVEPEWIRQRQGVDHEGDEPCTSGHRAPETAVQCAERNPRRQVMVEDAGGDRLARGRQGEVDEKLIKCAKFHKGKLITCDYNLEKKAAIENIAAINMNALANCLKIIAVPGEALHIKVSHQGKDPTQGVGYLDDGTMIVVEEGSGDLNKSLDVVVSRIIQTATGRILFAKKI